MNLPRSLVDVLDNKLDAQIVESAVVGGGCISSAARLRLKDGRQLLVKWHTNASQMFTAEARGLELLHAAGALRVPKVVAHQETVDDVPGFIAMEWLGQGDGNRQIEEALGQGLAELHRSIGKAYGLDHDNYIGANPQPNQMSDNWVTFFQEQRLYFQMELAGRFGYLNSWRSRLLNKLMARLGEWLPPNPPASLLHGDLWGGNWITTSAGEPALIDPAVYYGDREAELAFTELFGGFSPTFYTAYNHAWALDRGYTERKDLYNLYHLLNHLNLFGESYGSRVDGILRQYAG